MARIIIVTPDIVGPIKNGGIGTACFHYARTLADAGHTIDILFCGPVEPGDVARWRASYRARKIGFFTLEDLPQTDMIVHGARWYTERSWGVMQFLRQRDDQYVLFQDWHGNGFWSMRAKRMGLGFAQTTLGVIAHSPTEWQKAGMATFGQDPLQEADLAWTERRAIAEADILVSPSRHMIQWLGQHGFNLPKRVALCPYTFEDGVKPRLPPPDTDHLLFFGRLETRKGLHLLAGALRGLPAAALPRRVSLLGKFATVESVPTEHYLQDLRRDLPGVEIAAYTDFDYAEAVAFIAKANGIVVMPSTLDNLPLTVIECIANGFHFIASDVGGIPEMVDPRALFAATIASLQAMLERRSQIAFAALEHRYSPDTARQTWLEHIDGVVQHPPLATPQLRSLGEPGVSVCLPFFKHDRYLKRVINGFLRPGTPNLQLVFVNDGTAEADCSVFHEMARRLTKLGHVFHTQENSGPGGARNKAVSLARYDRVVFFDSDNVPFPGLVTALQEAFDASGADIVSAPFVAVPPMLRQPMMEDALFTYRPSGGSLAASMIDNLLGDMCSIWSRDVIEELGGFQTERFYWEDWELYIQAVGQGYKQLVHPEPLFFYTHEQNERRDNIRAHTNYSALWRRLDRLKPEQLADVARTFIEDFYVRRR